MSEDTEQIIEAFQTFTVSLEGPSKHMYEVYVKQAHVMLVHEAVAFAVLFVLAIMVILLARALAKAYDSEKDPTGSKAGALWFFVVVGCLFMCWALEDVGLIYGLYWNPEYWAIQELIKTLKP